MLIPIFDVYKIVYAVSRKDLGLRISKVLASLIVVVEMLLYYMILKLLVPIIFKNINIYSISISGVINIKTVFAIICILLYFLITERQLLLFEQTNDFENYRSTKMKNQLLVHFFLLPASIVCLAILKYRILS